MEKKLHELSSPPITAQPLGLLGANFLDARGRLEVGALVIESGKISSLGSERDLREKHPGAEWLNCAGWLVHPGFMNGHSHVAMSFMRELAHQSSQMIENVFFPLEKQLTPELVRPLSYPSIVAGLKSGVTCFFDHYYHIESVGRALEDFGLRGVISETLADIGGAMPGQEGVHRMKALLKSWPFSDRIRPSLGPHAMDTVSRALAQDIMDLSVSESLPVHMHMSQTQGEWDRVFDEHGKSPVALAKDWGLLGPRTLAVHLITADEEDWNMVQDSGTHVGLCPSSQILYEHLADLSAFESRTLPGVLGTDCAASHDSMDLWSELRTLHLLRRQAVGTPISSLETLKTVWDHPAHWAQLPVGKLEAGLEADLCFTRMPWETSPCYDLSTHLILSLSSRYLEHVMVQGRWVLWGQEPQLMVNRSWQEEYRSAVQALNMGQIKTPPLFPTLD